MGGKKVIFLIDTLVQIGIREENPFYLSLNFSLTGRIPEDVRISDLGFEEQFSLGKIFLILFV